MQWSLLHWRPTGPGWPSTSQSRNLCRFFHVPDLLLFLWTYINVSLIDVVVVNTIFQSFVEHMFKMRIFFWKHAFSHVTELFTLLLFPFSLWAAFQL